MSQPRRRRRRGRRRPPRPTDQNKREAVEQSRSDSEGKPPAPPRGRSRRSGRGRRGRTRNRDGRSSNSPKSSEDLVRGEPKRPPAQLTAPHDGTTLEKVIGDLQSEHGVPQHPQEYRITLKIADEKGDKGTLVEEKVDATEETEIPPGGQPNQKPRREKAPAAPRIGSSAAEAEEPGQSRSKKRRSRRRRRRPKGKPGGVRRLRAAASPSRSGTLGQVLAVLVGVTFVERALVFGFVRPSVELVAR